MSNQSPGQSTGRPDYQLPKHYFDPNFWVRGNKANDGAPSSKLVHIGVGHALSNWEHVESAAAMLFSAFVESQSIAAIRAYGTINGSRAREAALRQASETFFSLRKVAHKKDRATYDEIKKFEDVASCLIHNYGQASGRRTDIAHGIAWELSREQKTEQSWFLVAPNYQSPKTANWIEDDLKLREAKGLRLADPAAYFNFNKLYYKNSQYVFGVSNLKVFAGKFAYLYADILCLLHMLDPSIFKLTPKILYGLAKSLSE
jgi:hypothetical protein